MGRGPTTMPISPLLRPLPGLRSALFAAPIARLPPRAARAPGRRPPRRRPDRGRGRPPRLSPRATPPAPSCCGSMPPLPRRARRGSTGATRPSTPTPTSPPPRSTPPARAAGGASRWSRPCSTAPRGRPATQAGRPAPPPGPPRHPRRGDGLLPAQQRRRRRRRRHRTRGLARVAIVDWDVHHGNGTQDIFWARPARALRVAPPVPALPRHRRRRARWATAPASGRTVNLPLARRRRRRRLPPRLRARWSSPRCAASQPELVLVSAGFDAHARDPLASMQLTEVGYGWMGADAPRGGRRVRRRPRRPRPRRRLRPLRPRRVHRRLPPRGARLARPRAHRPRERPPPRSRRGRPPVQRGRRTGEEWGAAGVRARGPGWWHGRRRTRLRIRRG